MSEAAFVLVRLGPTGGNCQPLRLALVRSPVAKERLLPCLSAGNYEKVRSVPITAIAAHDREFSELLPRLFRHSDTHSWFTTNSALAEKTAFRNSSLQGAYFILALRRSGPRLRAGVRVRCRQSRCRLLSRRPVADQLC